MRRRSRSRGRMVRRRLPRRPRIDPERKFIDYPFNNVTPVINLPIIESLSQMGRGTGSGQRIGDQMLITSIQLKGAMTVGAQGYNAVRIMVLLDKMPDGNTLQQNDIITDGGFPMSSPLQMANSRRLKILWTRTISWSAGTPIIKTFAMYKTLNLPVRYNGAGGTLAGVTSNSLYLVVFGNSAIGNAPTSDFYIRLRFVG